MSLVIYFRDRRSYAGSLYTELLRHDYAATFDEFLAEIKANGTLQYREWVFQFAYCRVRAALTAYQDTRLVPRRYDAATRSGSVVTDLLPLLGLPADLLGEVARQVRNERDSTACTVAHFVANRVGRALTIPEDQTIARLLRQAEALGGAVRSPRRLSRFCSAKTVAAIKALAASPSIQAEQALLRWWGVPVRQSVAQHWKSVQHWWA